jgi:hypothetical protein
VVVVIIYWKLAVVWDLEFPYFRAEGCLHRANVQSCMCTCGTRQSEGCTRGAAWELVSAKRARGSPIS